MFTNSDIFELTHTERIQIFSHSQNLKFVLYMMNYFYLSRKKYIILKYIYKLYVQYHW